MFSQVDYRLEPEEYVRGMFAAFRRGLWICVAFIVFSGLLLTVMLAAPFVFSAATTPPLTTTVPVAVCCLYFVYQLLQRRARLKRRLQDQGVEGMSTTFTDSGVISRVRTRTGEHRSDVAWSGFVRIRETPEFFLFYPSPRTAEVVPKRAFDAEQAAMFSRFVKDGFAQARLARAESVAPST